MNSPLATYRVADTDNYGKRTHKIDTITPHCFVGQVTHKRGAEALLEKSYASANYVIGKDGVISVNVDEDKASMCSSNQANDQRAVTIEVASDTTHPYAVTDAAYQSLIQLMADICKRNGIEKLVWSTDKTARVNHKNGANITVHRDFAAKACPGDYLYSRMGKIAEEVNKKMEDKPMTYNEEFAKAIKLGITDGSNPDQPATRKQVAVMIYRAIKIVFKMLGKVEV